MSTNSYWKIACLIAALIVMMAAGVYVYCCLGHGNCDLCAYQVADWAWVLLQFGIAGAFGGLLALVSQFNPKDILDAEDDFCTRYFRCNAWFAMLFSAMGGVGGAGAALFFMMMQNESSILPLKETSVLKNATTGLIAGFLGFALLRRIADSFNKLTAQGLENQIKQAEQKGEHRAKEVEEKATKLVQDAEVRVETLKEEAKKAKTEADQAKLKAQELKGEIERLATKGEELKVQTARDASVLSTATSLGLQEYSKWKEWRKDQIEPRRGRRPAAPQPYQPDPSHHVAMRQLEEARKPFPNDRMAGMILSNLHYILGVAKIGDEYWKEHEKAIDILTDTINAIKARRSPSDSERYHLEELDISDLLYNRACNYSYLLERDPQDAALRTKLLDDLRECLRLNPANKTSARAEPDFKLSIGNDGEFQSLVA